MKRRLIISALLVGLVLLTLGLVSYVSRPPKVIYPTVIMTGSDGKIATIDPLVSGLRDATKGKAMPGLQIVVDTDNSLSVTGRLTRGKTYPLIEVGMTKGTNNSIKIEAALKAVMIYLKSHYHVDYCNLIGFSAGGGGDLRYLLNDNADNKHTIVRRWVSLDGQFNACTPQPNQTLAEVLKDGPKVKTKYYEYWLENYHKMNSGIAVALLAGNYKNSNSTDGVVPWADTFSIYPLLKKNGNPVTRYTFTGTESDTYHVGVSSNPKAQAFIAKFLYED
ncbi:MAG: alpha/beta hydrolase [Streptococcaceae bacterium]|jgi:uncharacterized alpha/beta hydrolase family protein|nr:alpha/beta hydrolase [Streptococcaceae bacterium]